MEICPVCNSVTNKGEKLALGHTTAQPFADWFHPHLRSAEGCYDIEIQNGVPAVVGVDDEAQARLDNLDGLINLSRRWARKYDNLVTRIQERIRHHCRRGKTFDRASLREQVQEWRIDAESEQGRGEYKLLETALLLKAEEVGSDVFEEFLEYAT